MSEFQIIFFKHENGDVPVKSFIQSLDKKMKAKTLRSIEILKKNGNELREPYSKLLDDGIFELRVKQGSDISRVLYFFVVGKKIVMTNGFIKKTNKTPKKEIEKSKKYREEYNEKNKEEEEDA